MDRDVRELTGFRCGDDLLAATLDRGRRDTGLLIVTGGTQVRIGAHRGQALLAARVAAAGFPVFRFDRRGIGDSDGDDPGFRASAPDIAAAAAAFRAAQPGLAQVIGFGLCDGAAALALHHREAGLDGLLLANPWVIEATAGLPPPAAIRRRYAARFASPAAWLRLLTGGIDLAKAARGLRAAAATPPGGLADAIAAELAASPVPVHILLAEHDATALAFAAEYRGRRFAAVRASGRATCVMRVGRSHSFAAAADADWLADTVIAALESLAAGQGAMTSP